MATRAEAIDILIDKGNFEPNVALAMSEAFIVMMTEAQIVTVPVLDARVADLRAEIRQVDHKVDLARVDLDTKIELFRTDLEAKIDRVRTDLEAKIDRVRTDLEAKIERVRTDLAAEIERVRTDLEAKIDRLGAELGKQIESSKAELIRWVLLAMLGSGAIQAGAAAFINAVQHH